MDVWVVRTCEDHAEGVTLAVVSSREKVIKAVKARYPASYVVDIEADGDDYLSLRAGVTGHTAYFSAERHGLDAHASPSV